MTTSSQRVGKGGLLDTDAATDEVVIVLIVEETAVSVDLGPLSLISMSLPKSARPPAAVE